MKKQELLCSIPAHPNYIVDIFIISILISRIKWNNLLTKQKVRLHIVQSVGKEVEYGMEQSEFCKRLVELRMNKGVSARDMSLSIGQSPGYINNIENGVNFPSMTAFFFICDYLNITPKEFFDTETSAPTKAHELMEAIKGLNVEQLDSLIAIAKNLRR